MTFEQTYETIQALDKLEDLQKLYSLAKTKEHYDKITALLLNISFEDKKRLLQEQSDDIKIEIDPEYDDSLVIKQLPHIEIDDNERERVKALTGDDGLFKRGKTGTVEFDPTQHTIARVNGSLIFFANKASSKRYAGFGTTASVKRCVKDDGTPLVVKIIDENSLTEDSKSEIDKEVEILKHLGEFHGVLVEDSLASTDKNWRELKLDESKTAKKRYIFLTEHQGKPLSELEGLSEEQKKIIAYELMLAIQEIHQKGVVHCDIKPQNVIVSKQSGKYQVKIIDYGISQLLNGEKEVETDKVQGTPGYIAPEIGEIIVDIDNRIEVEGGFKIDRYGDRLFKEDGDELIEIAEPKRKFYIPDGPQGKFAFAKGPGNKSQYSPESDIYALGKVLEKLGVNLDIVSSMLSENADDRPSLDDVIPAFYENQLPKGYRNILAAHKQQELIKCKLHILQSIKDKDTVSKELQGVKEHVEKLEEANIEIYPEILEMLGEPDGLELDYDDYRQISSEDFEGINQLHIRLIGEINNELLEVYYDGEGALRKYLSDMMNKLKGELLYLENEDKLLLASLEKLYTDLDLGVPPESLEIRQAITSSSENNLMREYLTSNGYNSHIQIYNLTLELQKRTYFSFEEKSTYLWELQTILGQEISSMQYILDDDHSEADKEYLDLIKKDIDMFKAMKVAVDRCSSEDSEKSFKQLSTEMFKYERYLLNKMHNHTVSVYRRINTFCSHHNSLLDEYKATNANSSLMRFMGHNHVTTDIKQNIKTLQGIVDTLSKFGREYRGSIEGIPFKSIMETIGKIKEQSDKIKDSQHERLSELCSKLITELEQSGYELDKPKL